MAFVGRVGSDDFGQATLDALRREGINIECVTVDGSASSGVALIIVDRKGENLIAVASGANARVGPSDVARAQPLIASADLVVLQLEIPLPAVRAALQTARQCGTAALLNPAPVPATGLPLELLAGLGYLTPNRAEAARLLCVPATTGPDRMASELRQAGVGAVIVTLGADGACVCDENGCVRIAAVPVKAVDTVGAGDCFSGVLAVGAAEGMPLVEAARFAACAAALSVQAPGAQPSLPRRERIDQLFREHRTQD